MAFKRFESKGGKASSPFPILSIWKRGSAGFNTCAIKLYELNKYDFIETYFDKDTNLCLKKRNIPALYQKGHQDIPLRCEPF